MIIKNNKKVEKKINKHEITIRGLYFTSQFIKFSSKRAKNCAKSCENVLLGKFVEPGKKVGKICKFRT